MSDATVIRGVEPREETRPEDEARLAEIVVRAGAEGSVCYIAGGLTKRDWGAPPTRIDLLVDIRGLSGCSDVDPDNLTLSAAAGTTVTEARTQAETVGRVLPIDPGHPAEATIGGVVATGDQGARSAGYGGLRDVVLGVRAVSADGTTVRFGGRTMKNVAGYDMTKLFVGSFGVLGVITEVTFRLLPRYDSQAVIVLSLASLELAKASVARILSSYLQPLVLEVVSADALPADLAGDTAGGPLLVAGFGGHGAAVDRSVREVREANPGALPHVLRDAEAEALYDHLTTCGPVSEDSRLGLRASVPISRALDVVVAARDYASAHGLDVGYRTGAARGRIDLLFWGAPNVAEKAPRDAATTMDSAADQAADFGACVTHMRSQAVSMGGSLIVTGGAKSLPAGYDPWGDVGTSLAIMKRVKERFDPRGILNPGRFVGGLR